MLVDNFPLLVHDIIIFKQMFTNIKVMAFYFFLGVFNGLADHVVLNRIILIHAKLIQHAGNSV